MLVNMREEGWKSSNVVGFSERLNHVEVEERYGPPHSFRLADQFVEVEIRNLFGKPGVEGVNGRRTIFSMKVTVYSSCSCMKASLDARPFLIRLLTHLSPK
jgi:hypothetical protein